MYSPTIGSLHAAQCSVSLLGAGVLQGKFQRKVRVFSAVSSLGFSVSTDNTIFVNADEISSIFWTTSVKVGRREDSC